MSTDQIRFPRAHLDMVVLEAAVIIMIAAEQEEKVSYVDSARKVLMRTL